VTSVYFYSIECFGGPLIDEVGDRVADVAAISSCHVPTILAPDQAVGISHHDGGCGSRSTLAYRSPSC
jgi:hypothetical protein